MGPLEAVKPWSMKGVEGVYRFLGRAWRMIVDAEADEVRLDPKVQDVEPTPEQAKVVARTVAAVTDDLEAMRFNTAISRLMEFTNAFTGQEVRPRSAMETFTLLLAPMAPHLAEELWQILGHDETLAYEPWPTFDPALLKDDEIEVPVQVNGKLRGRVVVPADADRDALEAAARADERIAALLEGKTIQKVDRRAGQAGQFRRRLSGRSDARSETIAAWHARATSSGSTWGRPTARWRTSTRKGRERPAADIRLFEVPQLVAPGETRPAADAAVVPLPARPARAAARRRRHCPGRTTPTGSSASSPGPGGEGPGPPRRQRQELALPPGRRPRGRHPPLGQPRRRRARSRRSRRRPTTCGTSATPGTATFAARRPGEPARDAGGRPDRPRVVRRGGARADPRGRRSARARESITLLEEPQAAFYCWIVSHQDGWQREVRAGELILVCDIGGGTTDFSLITVVETPTGPGFRRVAVGDHLMLGGDNIDLALAHQVEAKLGGARLDTEQWSALRYACRTAKEKLLGDAPPERWPVTIAGRGSRIIGGSIQSELTRAEVADVVLDGFFPTVGRGRGPGAGGEARAPGVRPAVRRRPGDPEAPRRLPPPPPGRGDRPGGASRPTTAPRGPTRSSSTAAR